MRTRSRSIREPRRRNVRIAAAALVLSLGSTFGARAQSARSSLEIYDEGPVWHMIFVRTSPGQQNAYLDRLSGIWSRQVNLAEKMGFVLDHHVLRKWASHPDDWDVLIIEIFPNMASYDSFWENWARVDASVEPDEADEERSQAEIDAIRTTLGVQIAREVVFKGASAQPPAAD